MRPPARPRRVAGIAEPQQPGDGRPEHVRPSSGAVRPDVPAAPARPPDGAGSRSAGRPTRPSGPGGRRAHPGPAAPEVVRPDEGAVAEARGWAPVRPPVVSTTSAARFAERVALRRRLTRRRLIGGGVAVLVLVVLGWLLLVSPVLALDVAELEIEGQGTVVDPAAVTAVVTPYDRTPLPRLDTVALRRQVLDVPGVRAAEVERLWPHGLRVTVVSREPVVAVPHAGGGVALLDVEGVQVGRAEAPPEGLPVVEVPLDDPGARALTAVLSVLERMPPELEVQVVAASAESQDTVAFELADGVRVEWGSADQTALKARVLQTLRAAETSRGARVFDVSAPTLPITTT